VAESLEEAGKHIVPEEKINNSGHISELELAALENEGNENCEKLV
jgi:hypothetical protein